MDDTEVSWALDDYRSRIEALENRMDAAEIDIDHKRLKSLSQENLEIAKSHIGAAIGALRVQEVNRALNYLTAALNRLGVE